jgi:hypothetical protein
MSNIYLILALLIAAKLAWDHAVLMTTALLAIVYIDMFQATLHSTGTDWILWPGFLIAAWWILLGKTWAALKLLSFPVIAVATYFVLFMAYHAIINIS